MFFLFCFSGFWVSLPPPALSKTMLRSCNFLTAHVYNVSIHLNKYKFKQYSESDTVHKILHKVWTLCFIWSSMPDRGFAWGIFVLHHSKPSLYYINLTPLSITNNLHDSSIKHALFISYHQCLIFSDRLHYTTQLILKAVFMGLHKIWTLRFIYFPVKDLIVKQRFNLNLLHRSKQSLCFVNSTPLNRTDCYRQWVGLRWYYIKGVSFTEKEFWS